jgi:tetratricopeptide (TPR) repeat protein
MKFQVASSKSQVGCKSHAALLIAIAAAWLLAGTVAAQTTIKDHIDAMRHLRLGQENLRAEKWDVAEREFKAAVQLEPALEMAHYGLGQAYMATKRYPAAVEAYIGCRDAYMGNLARDRHNDLLAQRRLEDQIQALEEERTAISTGRVTPMLSTGVIELDRRIHDLRTQRFRDERAPVVVPTWISIALGSAYFRTGAMPEAEREYRAAVAVDPRLGEAHNNLAVVYMLTRRFDEAEAEIKAAEKAGFKVNPQLKEDLKKASARR